MNNPYSLVFGRQPAQTIPRFVESNEVLEAFLNEPSNQQIYMITGVRGSGKTVFMTEIASELKQQENWSTLELSTNQNLVVMMAEALSQENRFTRFFERGFSLSAAGFGIQISGAQQGVSPLIVIREALDALRKHGQKLLICIDEVVVNDYMKEFASIFQILLREDYPIYLLMTGLYENINDLRDEKNLTFLYRAPEIRLRALNLESISENYAKNLAIPMETAREMSVLTKGYSFAFQVLGYFSFRHQGAYVDAMGEYRQYLEDYVYEKLWSELSRNDKVFLSAVANAKSGKAKEIKSILNWSNNKYTPYRDRMIKKMLVNGEEYGYLRFTLPLFEDYIIRAGIEY